MPTNPLPYQCGAPGCTRKFEKPEHLRQHTKDFHSPSRPPPSRSPPKQGLSSVVLKTAKPRPSRSFRCCSSILKPLIRNRNPAERSFQVWRSRV
ncbi:hypothetical protein K438DRAFT_100748 [Mycena galopus ATCC 62051]|nr:hypothetical protein K438DRAFT_100748 [Mycena galopus ATCC 62051]